MAITSLLILVAIILVYIFINIVEYFYLQQSSGKRRGEMDKLAAKHGLKNIFHKPNFIKCIFLISTDINTIEGRINNRQIKITDKIRTWYWDANGAPYFYVCLTSLVIDGETIQAHYAPKLKEISTRIRFIPIEELDRILTEETR